MTSYGARIFDRSTGRFVFTAPCVLSPYRVGLVTAGAVAALVNRDGLRSQDLELRSFAVAGNETRPMDRLEEAAMNAAFQQYISEARNAA